MDSSALRASTREKSLKLDKAVIRVFMVELVSCSMLPPLGLFISPRIGAWNYILSKNIIHPACKVNKVDYVYYEEKCCILSESLSYSPFTQSG